MKKQKAINVVLMNDDSMLVKKYTRYQLREMYVTLTGDKEEKTTEEMVCLLREFVNTTYTHNNIEHNLYAIHTGATDSFRAVFRLNELYGNCLIYPDGVIEKAYKELFPNGKCEDEEDMVLTMAEWLRYHDASAIYD